MWCHSHVCFICITLFLGSLLSETEETKLMHSPKNGSFKVTLLIGCTTEPLSYLTLSNLCSPPGPDFSCFPMAQPRQCQLRPWYNGADVRLQWRNPPNLVFYLCHRSYRCVIQSKEDIRPSACSMDIAGPVWVGLTLYYFVWGGWGCCLGWYLSWRLLCLINRIYFHRKIYVILSNYGAYRDLFFHSCLWVE